MRMCVCITIHKYCVWCVASYKLLMIAASFTICKIVATKQSFVQQQHFISSAKTGEVRNSILTFEEIMNPQ